MQNASLEIFVLDNTSLGLEFLCMATIFENINVMPSPYEEEEYIVICRVTEKEIEEAFPEIFQIKVQRERDRGGRKRTPLLQSFKPIRNLNIENG